MTTQWLQNAREKHIINKVLKGWIASGKTFRDSTQDGYKTSIFFNHIQILNIRMCILYREKDSTTLHTSWY